MTLTITAEERAEIVDKLVADASYGHPASYQFDGQNDGDRGDWLIRCKVEPDDIPVQDLWCDDAYGPISEHCYDYCHDGNTPRPDTMDGSAVKIQVDRGYWTWWQAPPGFPIHSEEWRKLRSSVRDLLEFGFQQVGVELCHGSDAYGRPIVVDCAWLGGVDTTEQEYLASLIHDLLLDLPMLVTP